ncbi:MAG: hypothetical protein L0H63_02610 [Nitrococcus sp.]|nr:hypothetical protein [Nitrococcus sp.]
MRKKIFVSLVSIVLLAACSILKAPDAGQENGIIAGMSVSSGLNSTKPGIIPGAECVNKKDVASLMGKYKIIATEKYGGGLTSQDQAVQQFGQVMVTLASNRVSVGGNKPIADPNYRVTCQPVLEEGEVVPRGQRLSNFYGFGTDRKVIAVLQVQDSSDEGSTPYYEFELVTVNGEYEMWYMSDGWLYKMGRVR